MQEADLGLALFKISGYYDYAIKFAPVLEMNTASILSAYEPSRHDRDLLLSQLSVFQPKLIGVIIASLLVIVGLLTVIQKVKLQRCKSLKSLKALKARLLSTENSWKNFCPWKTFNSFWL